MDDKIAEKLNKPPEHLGTRKQGGRDLTYVEGWWVIDQLNAIFGYNGWEDRIEEFERLSAEWHEITGKGQRFDVVCKATVVLTLRARDCRYTHEGIGYGSGMTYKVGQEIDAYEGAGKEAVTDALKRAARKLGNRLGNCLYDKKFLAASKNPPPTPEERPVYREPEPPNPNTNPPPGEETDYTLPQIPSVLNNKLSENPKYVDMKGKYIAKVLKGKGNANDLAGFHTWCEEQIKGDLKTLDQWTNAAIVKCGVTLKTIR